MSPSTPPREGHNSLLHLLNPYSSMARSSHPPPNPDPDSPSTLLLRELQGSNSPNAPLKRDSAERSRQSPTPTPRNRPTHVIATPSTSSEDEAEGYGDGDGDGDGPPTSIMFGEQRHAGGERTPKSPPTPLVPQPAYSKSSAAPPGRASSPGPFHVGGPPSSSASESRSRSTSPGPSTMSAYASGMENTAAESSSAPFSPREPSTSPEIRPANSARRTPTFREPPAVSRPPGPARVASGSSTKASTSPRIGGGQGYLDPPLHSVDRKGKGKARNQGGRTYHALPANAEDDEVDDAEEATGYGPGAKPPRKVGLNDYERALWRWVNVEDLDGFLQEVYSYYKGKGIWCILLARFLNLITTFFVIGFSTFLMSCIDYSKLSSDLAGPNAIERLDDVLIGQCLTRGSFPHMIFILSVAAVYVFQLASFALSIPRLLDMYRFYTHLLGIPDADIQTLPWPEIVRLVGEIKKHNPVTSLSNGQARALADMVGDDANKGQAKKLDAHDVANRILRQENYLIALFNKDLLDLRVRLPVPHQLDHLVPASLLAPSNQGTSLSTHTRPGERKFISFGEDTLSKALEWNLRFCLMGYLFDRRGQVRKEFVRERKRKDLVQGLKRRFIFMGVLNAIFAPFIVIYLLIYSFFRYFEEYHKNPSSIGSRQYTPYAQWKFREFNELPHLFERRLDRSYPTAKEYIDQFPKERTALVMRFVAFIAGSFAAVLLVASLIDPDLFLHFEITPHRTVLFYLGVFGSILAIARGMVPEENLVFDPEASLREVVRWTHYLPGEWRGKLHSQMVHAEFSNLFALKITVFFTELLSVLLTPFILLFSLPPCAGAIIDFFREFTVHVDGIGYVCSFAVFDFTRQGNLGPTGGASTGAGATVTAVGGVKSPSSPSMDVRQVDRGREQGGHGLGLHADRLRANENKMEKSFLHFKATHPDWQPDPSSSIFLDKLVGLHRDALAVPPPSSGGGGGGGLSGSFYAAGRGLGVGPAISSSGHMYGYGHTGGIAPGTGIGGYDENRLRERSRSYDRAWAKSSHLLRSPPEVTSGMRGREAAERERERKEREKRLGQGLETMREDDEEEAERMGWHARADGPGVGGGGTGEEEDEDEDAGYLRDVGVVGLLQQIMNR